MFLPENIDFSQSEKYILSIRLTPNGFSFSIHSPYESNVYCYKSTVFSNKMNYEDNIKKIIFDFSFFANYFNKVNIIVVSPQYTLVPGEFYSLSEKEQLFNFNISGPCEKVLADTHNREELNIIYNIKESLYDFLSRSISVPTFVHHSSILHSYFTNQCLEAENKNMFVNYNDKMVDMLVYDKGQLLLVKSYKIKDEQEALFFIMSIWEKMKFDQLEDCMIFSGDKELVNSSLRFMKRFIRNCKELSFINQKTELMRDQEEIIQTDMRILLCE